jgi:Helicase HerA, central domain
VKSFSITIGHRGPKSVKADAMRLVDSRLLGCANSGGGKSYLLRNIVEQVAQKIPTIVLDPEGEFSTLREVVDMVLVGPDGDVDADPRAAKLLVRKLVELRLSAVVDLSELKLPQRRLFVREFLETMIDLPQKLWGPTFVVLDEAHKFAPERGSGQSESTDAVISLMAQGRKRGYCGVLVTQRLSKLHKDAVGECNNVMLGRCVQDVDLKRAGDILGLASKDRNSLRSLKPGEFYAFGPAFDDVDGIVKLKTAKAKSSHPDARTRHKIKAPAPSAAIKKVLSQLSDLPERAAEERATLEASTLEVRRLERELRKVKKSGGVDEEVVAQAVEKAVDDAVFERDKFWSRRVGLAMAKNRGIGHGLGRMKDAIEEIEEAAEYIEKHLAEKPPEVIKVKKVTKPKPKTVTKGNGKRSDPLGEMWKRMDDLGNSDKLQPTERKILSALAEFPEGLDTRRLGVISGLATRGGSYNTSMKMMKDAGWIEGGGKDPLCITDVGIDVIGEPDPLPTGQALVDHWRSRLNNKSSARILDAFIEAYPKTLDTEAIGDLTGLVTRGGSFNVAMKRLKVMELISGRGKMSLNAELGKAAHFA